MLMDRKYYRELNKYRTPMQRLLFTMPWYQTRSDIGSELTPRHWVLRTVGPILMLVLGYRVAMYQADEENK